ncbi:MAG: hypothetical protein LBN92_00770, partial [Treponema sp.]|nr:hypothetical protein [Treponema sp.]
MKCTETDFSKRTPCGILSYAGENDAVLGAGAWGTTVAKVIADGQQAGNSNYGAERREQYYYHNDHLAVVTDYAGKVCEHMEYTPYGELWVEERPDSVHGTPYRFTGKELDAETG